ncbi:MAG: SurA N-terminal domain-containing protein [Bacteroidaceae bacterium]|nr:SurA N-terminal domain-containing protein [Bacteroidaceae bacterium]
MATLGKIRKHGWLLLVVIGIALLAFIVGDGIKALGPSKNIRNVGEINGDKISVEEYQKAVNEYEEVVRFARGNNTITEAEIAQIKDEVWNQMVSTKLIEDEVSRLGITVTPAELEAALDEGSHTLLAQSMFVNQQTGKFDKDLLYNFLSEYNSMDPSTMPSQYVDYYRNLYRYWNFIESNLKQELLLEKYESLVTNAQLSNPVAAQKAYDGRNNYCKLAFTVIPFTSLSDSAVTVTDADLRAVYNEHKENYRQFAEGRDVKYIDVAVVPSEEDRTALMAEVSEVAGQLAETAESEIDAVVRMSESTIPFSLMPRTAAGLAEDVAERIASMNVGEVAPAYYNEADDSYNTFKLLAKTTAPDSIQFRQIQVVEEEEARRTELGDSIYNALLAGADFAELAERYGQPTEPNWLGSASYERSTIIGDNATYLVTLNSMKKGEIRKLSLQGVDLILQVTETKNPVDKYLVADIKRPAYFSKDTYNAAYNRLSQFVASNQSIDDFKANAEEAGFRLLDLNGLQNTAHSIGGVASTRDALRWAFGAKKGEVSQIFEAGANDHLLALALEDIHPAGYASLETVKDMLTYEATNNKKAEKILASVKNVKTLAEAAALDGAKTDTLARVTFSSPVFVSAVPASEPALSGVAATLEQGQTAGPIKGNGGIYFVQVVERGQGAQTFDAAQEQKNAISTATRSLGHTRLVNELFTKGKVVDNRYLFF